MSSLSDMLFSNLNNMSIGERIKLAREMAEPEISQAELARRIGVTRSSVNQWESGDTKGLRPENLVRAAQELEVRIEWLAMNKGPMREDPQKQAWMQLYEKLSPDQIDAHFRLFGYSADQQEAMSRKAEREAKV
jgi:transcriptional regulator with XRE-family HTH domain